MPTLIILKGPINSGKTSLKSHLKGKIMFIDIDDFKNLIPHKGYSKKIENMAFKNALQAAKDFISLGLDVLVTHLFIDSKWINELKKIKCKENKMQKVFVLLKASNEIIRKRNLKRIKDKNLKISKKEADAWMENLTKIYNKSEKQFKPDLVIDTETKSVNEIAKQLLGLLKN